MANVCCLQVPCEDGSVRDADLRAFRSIDSPSNAPWCVMARSFYEVYVWWEEPGKPNCDFDSECLTSSRNIRFKYPLDFFWNVLKAPWRCMKWYVLCASCLYVSIFEASQQQRGLVPWACDRSWEHTLAAGPKGHRNWWIPWGISMVHGGWMGGNPGNLSMERNCWCFGLIIMSGAEFFMAASTGGHDTSISTAWKSCTFRYLVGCCGEAGLPFDEPFCRFDEFTCPGPPIVGSKFMKNHGMALTHDALTMLLDSTVASGQWKQPRKYGIINIEIWNEPLIFGCDFQLKSCTSLNLQAFERSPPSSHSIHRFSPRAFCCFEATTFDAALENHCSSMRAILYPKLSQARISRSIFRDVWVSNQGGISLRWSWGKMDWAYDPSNPNAFKSTAITEIKATCVMFIDVLSCGCVKHKALLFKVGVKLSLSCTMSIWLIRIVDWTIDSQWFEVT